MNINKTSVSKVSVTISRQEIWRNFVNVVATVGASGEPIKLVNEQINVWDGVREVGTVIASNTPLSGLTEQINGLFKRGYAVVLLGNDAANQLKGDVVKEVIVTDDNKPEDRVVVNGWFILT